VPARLNGYAGIGSERTLYVRARLRERKVLQGTVKEVFKFGEDVPERKETASLVGMRWP
jgi:hypothetical protein